MNPNNIVAVKFSEIDLEEMQRVEIEDQKDTLLVNCKPIVGNMIYQSSIPATKFPELSAKLLLNHFAVRQQPSGMILAIRTGAVRY